MRRPGIGRTSAMMAGPGLIGDGGSDGEEDAERNQLLLTRKQQWHEDQTARQAPEEDGEQHSLPAEKAPTIAIILMSPPPMASSLNTQVPTVPTSQSSPNPTAAPRSAVPRPGKPPARLNSRPMTRPTPGEFVGNDVLARVGHGDAEQDGAEHGAPERLDGEAVAPHHVGPDGGGSQLDQRDT